MASSDKAVSAQPPVPPKGNTSHLKMFLLKMGLKKFYPNKLTLRSLLEVDGKSISNVPIHSLEVVPETFMKRLMMVNADARCHLSISEETAVQNPEHLESVSEMICGKLSEEDNEVNPADLITAIFLCADSFLQQELTLKMSMCQFAVPLLLPQGTQNECTLMLWALRTVVKEWRPHELSESKGFVEGNAVTAKMPVFSFVRLSDCSLSKSQVLNQVLSNAQQYHDTFTHREMECGDVPKAISNGLVEISWFLPCGKKNLDILPEPVTIANMRGAVCSSEKQFRFLMRVSTAVFIFLDSVDEKEHKLLSSFKNTETKLFLVVNSQKTGQNNTKTLNVTIGDLKLDSSNIIMKTRKVNNAKFSNMLLAAIKQGLDGHRQTMNIEQMSEIAVEFGISIDEANVHSFASAKNMANNIVNGIGVRQMLDYKKSQLPLHGEPWKRLAKIEKEECRLKESRDKGLEEYKAQLQQEKQNLRQKQVKCITTKAMDRFITAISTQDELERAFFLKWMRLTLDVRSQKDLSRLRRKIKEQNESKQDKKYMAELDQQLMDSSLGIEHYMREMGQIYEASFYSSGSLSQQVRHLPALAADLLLDGFPLELVDGDASNIAEKWVTDVLMELHRKVGERSRLLVVTVLGVQSTGKSTLLNTMFGVQFQVSSGRCTRGAFMLFLKVGEDLKKDLDCDFILLIDTEGLKSPDLAQLEDSYEHDNELATLVIGLSDVTVINIAMENSTEMKDVIQIAVHAFLRMKEIGKKPVCHFVHQNVAGLSAHNKNITDRKHLLEQLNEMTQIAADMEKQSGVSKFTDVLDYDMDKNNWYIPGLWHGTPPMAPVNTGYSEAVYEFKQNLIGAFKTCKGEKSPSQIPDFLEWMRSLWKAVKYENFIFSFRNTLVAQAYDTLCQEFSKWEWAFRKQIYSWQTQAELQISNFQTGDQGLDNQSKVQTMDELLTTLKSEVSHKTSAEEQKMMENLKMYYKRKDRHIPLVEKYRGDFFNSIKSLRKEIERSVKSSLDTAAEEKITENTMPLYIDLKGLSSTHSCRPRCYLKKYALLVSIAKLAFRVKTQTVSLIHLKITAIFTRIGKFYQINPEKLQTIGSMF
ncbi:hypothetical protein AGOR_G00192290 [Albula goreensis]|uniref:VLIG-type G domain-containing protein n=1 Tax=Albula goreensis TaxID=1534307 RepID=A0A8T3CV57_9TELE|nr:hypothetical protein AGOR_G00192290 [Albula goreensis]